jgi:chromosome segregation ATPase
VIEVEKLGIVMAINTAPKKMDTLSLELSWAKSRLKTAVGKAKACRDRLRLAKQRQKLAKKAARYAKSRLKEAKHELKRAQNAQANLETRITLAKRSARTMPRPTRSAAPKA